MGTPPATKTSKAATWIQKFTNVLLLAGGIAYLQVDRARQTVRDVRMTSEFREVMVGFSDLSAEFSRQNEIDEGWLDTDFQWEQADNLHHEQQTTMLQTIRVLLDEMDEHNAASFSQREDRFEELEVGQRAILLRVADLESHVAGQMGRIAERTRIIHELLTGAHR